MRIQTRILASIVASLVASAVIASVVFGILRGMSGEIARGLKYDEIIHKTYALNLLVSEYGADQDPSRVRQTIEVRKGLDSLLRSMSPHEAREELLVRQITANNLDLDYSLSRLLSPTRGDDSEIDKERRSILVSQLFMKTQFIFEDTGRLFQLSLSRIEAAQRNTVFSVIALILALTLVNALLSYLSGKSIARAQESERDQREWLQVTLTSIGDAVIAANTAGRITFINPVASQLTGWGQEEAQGQLFEDVFRVINEKTGEPAENIVRRVLHEGRMISLANHTALTTREGHEIPIEDSAAPIRNEAGTLAGVVIVFHDVSEKRRAQTALRESEEQFRTMFQLAAVGMVQADPLTGALLRVNEKYCRITGYSADELLALRFSDITHPDDVERDWDTFQRAVRGESPDYHSEKRYVRGDGEVVWVSVSAALIRDELGRPVRTVAAVEDITERRQFERALRESREDLNRAQEVAQTGSWRLNVQRNELLWSDENHRIFGIPKGRPLTYETFLETIHPDDRGLVHERWMAALRGEPYDIDHRILVGDTVKWVREKATLEFDEQGALLGGFGTTQDITGRKRAEEAIKAAHAETLGEKNRLEAVMEVLPVGVAIVDLQGGVLQINAMYDTIWGGPRPPTAAVSDYGAYRAWWVETGRPVQAEEWASARVPFERGPVTGQFMEIERFDGARAFVLNSAAPIVDADGTIAGSVVAILDVTKLVQAEAALRESEARFRLLSMTAANLLAAENPQSIVEELAGQVMKHLDCQAFFNFLADERAGRLHLNACSGIPEEDIRSIEWLDYGVAVCGCAARDGVRIVTENILTTADHRTDLVKSYGIQAYACHPLMARGKVIGTLSFGTRTRPSFSPQDLHLMKTVSDQMAIAMERVRLIGELQQARDDLELRVRERTTQLYQAVQSLEAEIEEREEAQRILRESEQFLRTVLDTLPVGVWITDQTGTIVMANPSAERIWVGARYVGPVDYGAYKGWWAETGQPIAAEEWALARAINRGETSMGEIVDIQCFDGSRRTILNSAFPIRNDRNEIVRAIVVNQDITELRQAETELRSSEKRLRNSLELLQKIVDGITDPLIMLDRQGLVTMVNRAATAYYGERLAEDFLGKPCFEGLRGRETPCPDCDYPFPTGDSRSVSFERKGLNDPRKVESVTVYPVLDDSGQRDAVIIKTSDVTQAKLLERQILHNQKLASLGLMTSGIAHEINNPNSFIYFNIPILRKYLEELMPILDDHAALNPDLEVLHMSYSDLKEDIFKLLENMEHGSQRINKIVETLKSFVRKRDAEGLQQVDVRQVVDKVTALCQAEIKRTVKSFKVLIPGDLSPIVSDPEALEQVLLNLLINAIHACDKDDSRVSLKVEMGDAGEGNLLIEVTDNGSGIDEALQEKIFDPFFTTKPASKGTGLGLYICHHHVESLGGSIEVESRVGEGSTFRVLLPRTTIDEKAAHPTQPKESP